MEYLKGKHYIVNGRNGRYELSNDNTKSHCFFMDDTNTFELFPYNARVAEHPQAEDYVAALKVIGEWDNMYSTTHTIEKLCEFCKKNIHLAKISMVKIMLGGNAAKTAEEAWLTFDDEHLKDSVFNVWNTAFELGLRAGVEECPQSDILLSLRDCVELIYDLTKCDDGSLLPPRSRGKFNRAKDIVSKEKI